MDWLNSDNLALVLEGALAVIGAASLLLRFVSKLTSNTADDKALAVVEKVQGWLLKIVLPKSLR